MEFYSYFLYNNIQLLLVRVETLFRVYCASPRSRFLNPQTAKSWCMSIKMLNGLEWTEWNWLRAEVVNCPSAELGFLTIHRHSFFDSGSVWGSVTFSCRLGQLFVQQFFFIFFSFYVLEDINNLKEYISNNCKHHKFIFLIKVDTSLVLALFTVGIQPALRLWNRPRLYMFNTSWLFLLHLLYILPGLISSGISLSNYSSSSSTHSFLKRLYLWWFPCWKNK